MYAGIEGIQINDEIIHLSKTKKTEKLIPKVRVGYKQELQWKSIKYKTQRTN